MANLSKQPSLNFGSSQPGSRSKLARIRKLLLFIPVIAISSGFGFLGGWMQARNSPLTSLTKAERQQVISSESQLISGIAKDVGAGVVSINVVGQATQTDLFGYGRSFQQESAGTGFIISSEGNIWRSTMGNWRLNADIIIRASARRQRCAILLREAVTWILSAGLLQDFADSICDNAAYLR